MFADRPAKAEPLLLPADMNAYSTSDRPCGPALRIDSFGPGSPIASPVPASTSTGIVRMYSETSLISRAVIFFRRYSGVRPTISPAMNTVTMASTSIPYRPEPTPPGATSPRPMLKIVKPPPSAVNEEWNEFTAPVDVPVVDVANSDEAASPNRVSLPSIDAPARLSAVPGCRASSTEMHTRTAVQRTPIAARIAYPCRLSLTIRPNV